MKTNERVISILVTSTAQLHSMEQWNVFYFSLENKEKHAHNGDLVVMAGKRWHGTKMRTDLPHKIQLLESYVAKYMRMKNEQSIYEI